jgi:hypothetical protein
VILVSDASIVQGDEPPAGTAGEALAAVMEHKAAASRNILPKRFIPGRVDYDNKFAK